MKRRPWTRERQDRAGLIMLTRSTERAMQRANAPTDSMRDHERRKTKHLFAPSDGVEDPGAIHAPGTESVCVTCGVSQRLAKQNDVVLCLGPGSGDVLMQQWRLDAAYLGYDPEQVGLA